jgi:outer membrane lipoprotein-sorting protein
MFWNLAIEKNSAQKIPEQGARKGFRPSFHIVLPLILATLSATTPAEAATQKEQNYLEKPESILKDQGSDGTKVVTSMFDRTRQLKAYTFDSILSTFINGKQIVETGKLYFKSPNLIRFEAKRAGKRSGSVVVRQRDGKIRGKMGGALGGIKVTLSPDSKLLKTSNGFSILDSDLTSLLTLAVEKLKVNNCLTGKVEGVPSQVVELVESDGDLIYRMAVEPSEKLPERWSLFKGDALFSTVQFANLQILADLPDALFTFAKEAAEESPAQNRGTSMSLAEYRLQFDSLKRNLLVDSLKELDSASSLNALSYQKLQDAINLLTKDIAELTSSPLVSADSDSWIAGGQQTIVLKCTEMELLFAALAQIGKLDKLHGTEEEKKSALLVWNEKLLNCREAVARIIDEIEDDAPKSDTYSRLVADLEEKAAALAEASKAFAP